MRMRCYDNCYASKRTAAGEGRCCEVWSAREERRENGRFCRRKQARTATRAMLKRREYLLAEPSVAHVEDGLGDIKVSDVWNYRYAEALAYWIGTYIWRHVTNE